jgi:hypothetical protein
LPTGVAACASAQAIEVRGSHELVLLASFGGRQCHAAFPSIFDGLAREHSPKPDEFYKIIVDKTPGQTRCDLFSRQTDRALMAGANGAGRSGTDRNDFSHETFPSVSCSPTVLFDEFDLANNFSFLGGGREERQKSWQGGLLKETALQP